MAHHAPDAVDADLGAAFTDARVLVTGGAGFIGSHLVEALLDLRAEVAVVDGKPIDSVLGPRSSRLTGHVLRVGTDDFREYLVGAGSFDYVFHLAGRAHVGLSLNDPQLDFSTNLTTTLHLLETLRRHELQPRLVFASSAAVYGNPDRLPIDESVLTLPISPYGVGKLAAERYVAVYARLFRLPAASVRMFSIYGPRQTKQVIYDFMAKLAANPSELLIHGDGTQVRDFLYVADAVRAFLLVAARGRTDGFAYNVASGEGTAIGDLARQIVAIQQPAARVAFTTQPRPGDPDRWIGSAEPLRDLGWRPRWPLSEGLVATAAWFRATDGGMVSRPVVAPREARA